MARFRHVLAAVDLTGHSERVVSHAEWLARTSGAPLTLLHVAPDAASQGLFYLPEVGAPAVVEPVLGHSEIWGRLCALAQKVAQSGPPTLALRQGEPAREILRYVSENDIDLAVVGRHPHGVLDRLFFEHPGAHVAREAPCSVLAVPAAEAIGRAAPPSLEVVCALDLSETSPSTLARAVDLAWARSAHLTALHVIDASHWEDPWPLARGDEGAVRRALTLSAHERLSKLLDRCHIPGADFDTLILFGRVGPEIARVASVQGASLLVMGAHRGRVLGRTFLGSTARHVLASATCPVLLVRAEGGRPAQERPADSSSSASSSPCLRE
jgi:nucleotide-binding universal stress UspA family protein